jgi:hypothetical protein
MKRREVTLAGCSPTCGGVSAWAWNDRKSAARGMQFGLPIHYNAGD